VKKTVRVSTAKSASDGDGNQVANEILLSLPQGQFDKVLAKLELVRLKLHQILHEPGETLKSGYFVNSGMVSILAIQPDGKSVEVGLIGREGFVGMPLLVGYRTSATRAITQGDATAYRCDAEMLREFVRQSPELEQQINRFGQKQTMQSMQIAACNRLHDVEERMARWIVMSQDRILTNTLPLTQEFLGQMLGTRRSSVTVAASFAEGGVDLLYPRQRDHLEPARIGRGGVRLLRHRAAATKGVGSTNKIEFRQRRKASVVAPSPHVILREVCPRVHWPVCVRPSLY
jgi:CRP-like cAMP-binding protein